MFYKKSMAFAFLAVGVAAASLANAQANGTLYFSEDGNGNGLYSLNYLTGAATNLGISGVTSSTVGLTEGPNPGKLLGSAWIDYLEINADGSGATALGAIFAEGMAYHAANNTLYASLNGSFFSASLIDGSETASLASALDASGAPLDIEGLASAHGKIFGIVGFADADTGLYAYDIGLNSWSFVGDTGIDWNEPGLAYDPIGGLLYAKGSQDSFLYSIDPLTGATLVVGDTGLANGGGLGFIKVVPEPTSMAALGLGALALLRRRKSAK
jgi:hypothetical protein